MFPPSDTDESVKGPVRTVLTDSRGWEGHREARRLPKLLDAELHSWPIDEWDRRRISERRLSMFGRTDWSGYPPGIPRMGRTGWTILLLGVIPVACILSVLGLILAGSPNAAFAFGMTFLAEAGILSVVYRDRRRSLTRAAAVETGHPVCLFCGYYNLDHELEQACSECGAPMAELPEENFPPPEEDETVVDMRRRRKDIQSIRYEKS